jgi:hypothetical protein
VVLGERICFRWSASPFAATRWFACRMTGGVECPFRRSPTGAAERGSSPRGTFMGYKLICD